MSELAPPLERAVHELAKLPGVGKKTAQRLAFHLLQVPREEAGALARAILELRERIRLCRDCYNLSEQELCHVCTDPRREQASICVVEDPGNLLAIERTRAYRGLYHVLGGALSPLKDKGPDDLRLRELMDRVRQGAFGEVVLATNPDVEGEATAVYISRLLRVNGSRGDSLKDIVKATSQDFLWPTLFGALVPGRTRGEEIERAWQRPPVGLEEHTLRNLVERWKEAQNRGDGIPPFPMPLFNTASLDAHDVVISPLAIKLYDGDERCRDARSSSNSLWERLSRTEDDPLTWVFYRDCIYGIEDFLGDQDLLLSSAVLASANFPFGFPVVKVAAERGALVFSPVENEPQQVKLTDGGALSNSGLWSLVNLLLDEAHFEELRKRGVLLLIVEASKMPTYRSFESTFNSLLGTIGDQGPIGRNLHNRMLDVLKERFGDRLATVQIDLVPRESLNVMTTWALDESTLRSLKKQSFEVRWMEEKVNLMKKWDFLTNGTDLGGVDSVDLSRPPLD